jgi:DNA-binding Xre family transcriptional regulator
MLMRLRFPEIFAEHKLTAYEIAKRSEGRVQASTLYRLARRRGKVDLISADLLETLCDILGVGPERLLEREPRKRGGKGK